MLPVENEESVRYPVDHGLLSILHLCDGECAVGYRLDERIHREGQFGEFVVPAPVKARAVSLSAMLAGMADAFRHFRQRIEQQPALEPEYRQDKDEADNAHEKREPSDGGSRRVGEPSLSSIA